MSTFEISRPLLLDNNTSLFALLTHIHKDIQIPGSVSSTHQELGYEDNLCPEFYILPSSMHQELGYEDNLCPEFYILLSSMHQELGYEDNLCPEFDILPMF